jgi:hypothetical protein
MFKLLQIKHLLKLASDLMFSRGKFKTNNFILKQFFNFFSNPLTRPINLF